MLSQVERDFITEMARRVKLRGLAMLDVVTELQKCQDFVTDAEYWDGVHDEVIEEDLGSPKRADEADWFFWGERLKHIEAEIKRRRLIPQYAQAHDNEILLAIKQVTALVAGEAPCPLFIPVDVA